MRKRPPNRREWEGIEFEFDGHHFVAGPGYCNGDICEAFFSQRAKTGTIMDGILYDAGVLLSIAIQSGTSIEDLAHSVCRDDSGNAASPIGKLVDLMNNERVPWLEPNAIQKSK